MSARTGQGSNPLLRTQQESAAGIVARRQTRGVEALQSRKAEQRIGQAAKRAGEGPNGARPEWGGK